MLRLRFAPPGPPSLFPLSASLLAQQSGRTLTDADYRLAESRLSYNTEPLVAHTVNSVHFLPGNRLWYRDAAPASGSTPARATYVLVDPATKTASPAFDHATLAHALAAALPGLKPSPDPAHLQLSALDLLDLDASGHPRALTTEIAGKRLRCTLTATVTCSLDPRAAPSAASVLSPDGAHAAFLRDWNLWLRDTKSGAESQLTHDGLPDFGYATDNAGWTRSQNPILVWSPDSRHIATFQQDQRKTGTFSILPVTNGHPQVETWRYPFAGDKDVTLIERVILDVPSGKVIRLKTPPDQHRSTICDDVSCSGSWDDVQWAPDSKTLAFVSTSRDHRQEWLRVADTRSGDVHDVYTETVPTFFDAGNDRVNWHYLPGSNEFLWFSEKSGWGQLYLYDLKSGQLKNQVTTDPGNVLQVLSVDARARRILYLADGKDPARDPYLQSLHAVDFSGKDETLLTPENTNHDIFLSPDASLFVDVSSTSTAPQRTTVRDTRTGAILMPVAQQDISALLATGWKPPTPFTVKGRDGTTDLYGFLYQPTSFDPAKKYPVVDYIYPGPVLKSCPDHAFHTAVHDNQALAELGFLVLCVDGMGTAYRSKAFHTTYYGHLEDNTLPDQITTIRQLAARLPAMDLDRVGIGGHSGGGAATAAAMFQFPDFFKVGISESGNHDERLYEDDWAEKWAGLEQKKSDGTSNYDAFANQNLAGNLKGHLLLVHGTSDTNVPLNNTLLVVDALIKANRDFDLILIPNSDHAYPGDAGQYIMRRRWDYFTRYLAGNTPPDQYHMTPYAEAIQKLRGPSTPAGESPQP